MCGGCNVLAEGAGISLIAARYWWVARQGRKAVLEAERHVAAGARPVSGGAGDDAFVDPMPELTKLLR